MPLAVDDERVEHLEGRTSQGNTIWGNSGSATERAHGKKKRPPWKLTKDSTFTSSTIGHDSSTIAHEVAATIPPQ
jgi:hypothetical protein